MGEQEEDHQEEDEVDGKDAGYGGGRDILSADKAVTGRSTATAIL
jgi:hypothetical protein